MRQRTPYQPQNNQPQSNHQSQEHIPEISKQDDNLKAYIQDKLKDKPKTNKQDRIFIWSLAAVAANLTFWLINRILLIMNDWSNRTNWFFILVLVLGIIGLLYLLQNNRNRRRNS
jgi:hypothetical protein